MSKVTLGGNPIEVAGRFPQAGDAAPAFSLTGADLADVGLGAFAGKRKVLNIVPSLDTPVCAASARKFNDYRFMIAAITKHAIKPLDGFGAAEMLR